MVGFAESVTVFDANNESRELPLHPDGKFYDAKDNQDTLSSESMHLSEGDEDPSFMDAYSDLPDGMISFSALNKSAGDLWDGSFESFTSEASMSHSHDALGKTARMENSMSLEDIPMLVDATNANGSGGSLGSPPKKGEEEEEDPTRQFVKQMGYGLMLQGGMYFAMDPLMRLGKRLLNNQNNEEDVVEDAAAAHVMVNRSGNLQHGMLNRGGDFSSFAQAGAHESSRNMTGAFVVQQDVTAQVMKQAMIQAAQTAGASVGQGAATITVAASAGATAGGATAVAAGGAAAAATMSAKFAVGVAIGSIIAAGGLGGATLGSYMAEEEMKINVPKPVFAENELVAYKFDTLDLASGIAPSVSPESFVEDLGSLGLEPTPSPGDDLSYDILPSRSPLSFPASEPPTNKPSFGGIPSPVTAPIPTVPGNIGVPTSALPGSPIVSPGLAPFPVLSPTFGFPLASPQTMTSPIAMFTNTPTGGFVLVPAPTTGSDIQTPFAGTTASPTNTFGFSPTATAATPRPSMTMVVPSVPTGQSMPTSQPFPTGSAPAGQSFPTGNAPASQSFPTGSAPTGPSFPTGTGPTSPVVPPTVVSPTVASPVSSPGTISPPSPTTIATTDNPTQSQTQRPTEAPSRALTESPTRSPTTSPTSSPTNAPVLAPVTSPVLAPNPVPSPVFVPVPSPVFVPVPSPVFVPVPSPVVVPVNPPSMSPTPSPSAGPPSSPSADPTSPPSVKTTSSPLPTVDPTTFLTAAPTTPGPVGTITGWSLVDGLGTVLIASLTEGQTISTVTYGTDLKVQAIISTANGPVGSVSLVVSNNGGGGSNTIWDKVPPFQTSNSFLSYASVKIKGTPLPSSTNQGNKGTQVELNLLIVNT